MDKASEVHFFVYGTLLFDEIVEGLCGRTFDSLPAMLQGYKRHGVSPPGREGEGPILVRSEGQQQLGRVLLNVDARSEAILDAFEFESPGYERIVESVQVTNSVQEYECIVYVGTQALIPFVSGDWSPDTFSETGLSRYTNEFIPDLLERFAARGII